MYLSDYHTHSRLSSDTHAPLSKLAETAIDVGLDELCVIDHSDFLDENGVPAEGYDWAPVMAQHQQALPAAKERLILKLGLELGMLHLNPTTATAICTRPEADLILGSVHSLLPERGGIDLFLLDFSTVQVCYDALDDYSTSLALLITTGFYDVLVHLVYPLRYVQAPVTLNRYQDAIRATLHTAVEKGRGMGINTYRGYILEGWRSILTLYRDCGGEIATASSDVHIPAGVGRGVQAVCVLLREYGSRHACTYEKYQPVFHILE